MRAHDTEISEAAQPLTWKKSEQRQNVAATTTTNKRAATRTKRELSDAREGEMEGEERGIEKEHETVTTSIPRNAFNSVPLRHPSLMATMGPEAMGHRLWVGNS